MMATATKGKATNTEKDTSTDMMVRGMSMESTAMSMAMSTAREDPVKATITTVGIIMVIMATVSLLACP
jgi:hypothetical protein